MEVVPLGPKRVKLSQNKDYRSNWQDVQPQLNNQKADILKEKN